MKKDISCLNMFIPLMVYILIRSRTFFSPTFGDVSPTFKFYVESSFVFADEKMFYMFSWQTITCNNFIGILIFKSTNNMNYMIREPSHIMSAAEGGRGVSKSDICWHEISGGNLLCQQMQKMKIMIFWIAMKI